MPIHAVPHEILSRIFCDVSRDRITPSDIQYLGTFDRGKIKPSCKNLLLVCSKWRDLVDADDKLWHFHMNLQIGYGKSIDSNVSKANLRPNCDISLAMRCTRNIDIDLVIQDFTKIQDTLILFSHRIQACIINVTIGWMSSDVQTLLSYLSFPRLVMLKMVVTRSSGQLSSTPLVPDPAESGLPAISQCKIPMLESLYFESYWVLFPETNYLQNLSHLSLSNPGYRTQWDWKKTIQGLSVCKDLRTLSLEERSDSSDNLTKDFMVELPRLRQLKVIACEAALFRVLAAIKTPELILLSIVFAGGGPEGDTLPPPDALLKLQTLIIDRFVSIARRFLTAVRLPSLENLRISGGDDSVGEPAALQCPNLRSLDLTGGTIPHHDFTWLLRSLSLCNPTPPFRFFSFNLSHSYTKDPYEGFSPIEMPVLREISTLSIGRLDNQSSNMVQSLFCAAENVRELRLSFDVLKYQNILEKLGPTESGAWPLPSLQHLTATDKGVVRDTALLQTVAKFLESRATAAMPIPELQLAANPDEGELTKLQKVVSSVIIENPTAIGEEAFEVVW